jgi:hypothetical protein
MVTLPILAVLLFDLVLFLGGYTNIAFAFVAYIAVLNCASQS